MALGPSGRPRGLSYPCYWMYKDVRGQWRWVYYASNAEEIAVSSESYVRKADCERSIQIMKASHDSDVYEPSNP